MSPRYYRFRQIARRLAHISPGIRLPKPKEVVNSPIAFSRLIDDSEITRASGLTGAFHSRRWCSSVSQVSHESCSAEANALTIFIESAITNFKRPGHCWLNTVKGKDFFTKDGIFLVLAGRFLEDPQIVSMLETVKLIQQRFPRLCVMGLHYESSLGSSSDMTCLVKFVMDEYITFPILLTNQDFSEMGNEPCCILFKDFGNPVIYREKALDLGMLNKAVEELYLQSNEKSSSPALKSSWVKEAEVIKEPHLCTSSQNLLLFSPGGVSADESGDRIFLSDSNHHRIIVTNGNGKILDCIGSCPGFEDGEFESAKLARPAASLYNDAENCLYIVDSENHAIRRADMERRVLETLYPTCSITKKTDSLWAWIMDKLGFGGTSDPKSEEFNPLSLVFPWHLLKSADDNLVIISRSFETLWILDLASGKIKEHIKGSPRILETYGQLIMEKASILKQFPSDWLQQRTDTNCSLAGLSYASHISSITSFHNHVIMSDAVSQRVLKVSRDSGTLSNFQFSNFEILGLPYWLPMHMERVYSSEGAWTDHFECFTLLPGRIDMLLNIDIPVDTELVEPLKEGCIWRQARGAATEVLGAKGIVGSSDKVGIAQQWYDELDNVSFSTIETDASVEDDETSTSNVRYEDEKVHIDCAVNTSPGTSEVVIHAALYLKLKRHPDPQEYRREEYAARIAEISNRGGSRKEKDACIQLLLKSNHDLMEYIFMRPLHVRIKLNCLDHPKADNGKDIVLTDSSIEVNVSLES